MENGCTLILLTNSPFSVGATAPFSMLVTFVDAEWYFVTSLESGKIFLIVGDSLSWNANGILEAAATTANFNSAAVRRKTSSEENEFGLRIHRLSLI